MNRDPVATLLADLRSRDVHFELHGDRVHVDAPKASLSDLDRQALKSIRDEVRSRLEFESTVVDMSFEEFAKTNLTIKIAVPGLDRTLWLIPDANYIDQLLDRGVGRGQIWTAAEMADLYAIDGVEPTDRVAIAKLKASFGATVLSVEPWAEADAPRSDKAPGSCRACRGTRFWRSVHGVVVCRRCHPPAGPGLVAEWLDEPSPEGE